VGTSLSFSLFSLSFPFLLLARTQSTESKSRPAGPFVSRSCGLVSRIDRIQRSISRVNLFIRSRIFRRYNQRVNLTHFHSDLFIRKDHHKSQSSGGAEHVSFFRKAKAKGHVLELHVSLERVRRGCDTGHKASAQTVPCTRSVTYQSRQPSLRCSLRQHGQ
jgi:hypothetical protein